MFIDLILPGLIVAILNIIVMFLLFRHKFVFIEYIAPIFLSFVIGFLIKVSCDSYKTQDIEYHGGWIVQIENQKAWVEWEEIVVPDYCTDSKGNTYVCGSHTETIYIPHFEYWRLTDSNGYSIYIDDFHYEEIEKIWNQQSIITDGHRNDYHFHSGDGRYIYCDWNGLNRIPCTTVHSYVNKVQAADQSIFHFNEVSKEDIQKYSLYEYPPIYSYYKMNYISGNAPNLDQANVKLENLNAVLGKNKQVNIRILIFNENPIEAALLQEALWQGGNKNEFIVCIGTDKDYNVKWSHIISWTQIQKLKIKIRDYARSMKTLDLLSLIDYMGPEIEKDYKRREFKEFNYLEIRTTFGEKITSFIITLVLTIIMDIVFITNDLNEDNCFLFGNVFKRNSLK